MELKREPHVSELEEAVDREIAIVEARNAARKQKRAATQIDSENENDKSISDSRWKTIQDFIKKWEPKLEKWNDLMGRIEFEEVVLDALEEVRAETT
jgi:hypothetical protein